MKGWIKMNLTERAKELARKHSGKAVAAGAAVAMIYCASQKDELGYETRNVPARSCIMVPADHVGMQPGFILVYEGKTHRGPQGMKTPEMKAYTVREDSTITAPQASLTYRGMASPENLWRVNVRVPKGETLPCVYQPQPSRNQ
jgi:hypothetical protein